MEREEINRVADDVWQEMKTRLDVEYKRPRITTSDEETMERFNDLAKHCGIKRKIPPCKLRETYGSMMTLVDIEEGKANLLLSPIQIRTTLPPETARVTLAHEFGHYLYYVSDPHFATTIYIFNQRLEHEKEIEKEQIRKMQFFLNAMEESLAWIPSLELHGEKAVMDSFLKYLEKDSSIPEQERKGLYQYHSLMVIYAAFLGDEGINMKDLLDPLSVMNEKHPIVRLNPRNKIHQEDFLKAYADVKDNIVPEITTYVDDVE